MSAYRKDNFEFNTFEKTSNGFLRLSGIVTRAGVFKYRDGNELRSVEEVTNTNSLDTMFAIPVTWGHPNDLINTDKLLLYQKGFVASKPVVEVTEDNVTVIRLDDIIVQDAGLIYEITENGLREFSLGYTCDLEEITNEDYVRVQKNIIYNHLALVRDSRCGKVCSIIQKEKENDIVSKSNKDNYKADCACQKAVKKDEGDKMEMKKEEEKDEIKKEEIKKDEESGEGSNWEKMFSQHNKMIELLTKILEGKSNVKEDEKEKDEMKKEIKEDEEDEEKNKRMDSINSFSFVTNETKNNKMYDRNSFFNTVKKG